MLTPHFKLAQDDNHVFITVHAPYTNIAETEIDVDGESFCFVSSPYFLRLRLPGRIVENDRSKGSYTCDSGDFSLTFDKENPGEHFANLDMITSVLAPRDIPDINPDLVEMLEDNEVSIDQEDSDEDDSAKYAFGFANKLSTEFKEIGNEFPQIFELRVPEQVPISERNILREKYEEHKFSSDHYLADFFDKELLAPYLDATLPWDHPDFENDADFTVEEVAVLKELPNKHYLLSNTEYRQVLYGLIDILFSFCYDKRTTLNESNVESSWTINKLSATFSWFCVFNDVKDVIIACYRRSLVYPIFRNFNLCEKVKNDLVSLLKKGKKHVIKCVISIHQMFNLSTDARYILNQLYMKDYLIFLQKCKTEEFDELSNKLAGIDINKNDLALELVELEAAAVMVQQEESQIIENKMALKMASMSLSPGLMKYNYLLNGAYFATDTSDSGTPSASSDSSDDSSDLDSDDDPA